MGKQKEQKGKKRNIEEQRSGQEREKGKPSSRTRERMKKGNRGERHLPWNVPWIKYGGGWTTKQGKKKWSEQRFMTVKRIKNAQNRSELIAFYKRSSWIQVLYDGNFWKKNKKAFTERTRVLIQK